MCGACLHTLGLGTAMSTKEIPYAIPALITELKLKISQNVDFTHKLTTPAAKKTYELLMLSLEKDITLAHLLILLYRKGK
jgi:hypothetical protein